MPRQESPGRYTNSMENKATKLNRSADGMFLTSENPSPLMTKVMENIKRQMQAETERRDRIRAGIAPAGDWGTFSISDRH